MEVISFLCTLDKFELTLAKNALKIGMHMMDDLLTIHGSTKVLREEYVGGTHPSVSFFFT